MKFNPVVELLRKSGTSTADTAAAIRAIHQRERVRIFKDPYAGLLCGWFWRLVLRIRPLEWLVTRVTRSTAPTAMCVLMRARYAEQALEQAVEARIAQYAIIGAGMDSFAFRRPDLVERIQVFEIDHPAMQRIKLERVRRAGLPIPGGLHFVPADLAKISAVDALAGSGFDMSRPTFLTLLGVSYYITSDSLAETARSISRHLPAGTLLTLDYLLAEESVKPEHVLMRKRMKSFVARMREPMVSEYSLDSMNAMMSAQGFETVGNFALSDLERRYTEEIGALPFEIPSIFALGTFRVAACGASPVTGIAL